LLIKTPGSSQTTWTFPVWFVNVIDFYKSSVVHSCSIKILTKE